MRRRRLALELAVYLASVAGGLVLVAALLRASVVLVN